MQLLTAEGKFCHVGVGGGRDLEEEEGLEEAEFEGALRPRLEPPVSPGGCGGTRWLRSIITGSVSPRGVWTLREETYKKSKKTGTEKLRCKLGLDDLDAELVDDLVGLPGPVPCTLEFRTPCDDGELD